MAFRANQHLREDMWDYRYKSAAGETGNVVKIATPAPGEYGPTALNLVHQAAEIFNDMENRVCETEARVQSVCESLTGKLQLAERQRDASERARHEVVDEFSGKLQDVAKALQQAQSRMTMAEDRAVAAEFRAQSAEVQLYRANRELAAVEEAIRTRLL